jgi:hypothetical protein
LGHVDDRAYVFEQNINSHSNLIAGGNHKSLAPDHKPPCPASPAAAIRTTSHARSTATAPSAFDVRYALNSGAKADVAGGPDWAQLPTLR